MQAAFASQFSGFGESRRAVFPRFEGRPVFRHCPGGFWPGGFGTEEIRCAARIALAQEIVACALSVPVGELRAPTRRKAQVAVARQIAMYLSHVAFGLSLSAVGQYFGRDRTTAAHACRQMEDRRDDRDFDLLLDRLEGALHAMSVAERMQ